MKILLLCKKDYFSWSGMAWFIKGRSYRVIYIDNRQNARENREHKLIDNNGAPHSIWQYQLREHFAI